MAELTIKVDIPPEFKDKFELALARVIKEVVNKLELIIAEEIISKSDFSEQDTIELSEKVKKSLHNKLEREELDERVAKKLGL